MDNKLNKMGNGLFWIGILIICVVLVGMIFSIHILAQDRFVTVGLLLSILGLVLIART